MPRKSTVFTLPAGVRKQLDRALMRGDMTLDQLHAFIASCCEKQEEAPSRSALGRYASTFQETAKSMRENREMARALAQELGPESIEGEQGRLLVEILRGLVFKTLQRKAAEGESAIVDINEVTKIARSLKDLSHAMHLEQDFARRIKDETRKEMEVQIKERIKNMGSAKDLKELSDADLEKRIAELAQA